MARPKKTTNDKVSDEIIKNNKPEKVTAQETKEVQSSSYQIVIITGEVKLRKYANLNNSDVVGFANVGARFKITAKLHNERGDFYKLSNGYFVEASNHNIRVQ